MSVKNKMKAKTLEELKAENTYLKNKIKGRNELRKESIETAEERNRLSKENKDLAKYLEHPRKYDMAKIIGETFIKIGKGIGKGFMIWARRIAEAKRIEDMLERKKNKKSRKKGK